MCKGLYVILQGGSPIEKVSNVSFDFHYLKPMVFTNERYKKVYYLEKKQGVATLYRLEKKIFLSIVERQIFSC